MPSSARRPGGQLSTHSPPTRWEAEGAPGPLLAIEKRPTTRKGWISSLLLRTFQHSAGETIWWEWWELCTRTTSKSLWKWKFGASPTYWCLKCGIVELRWMFGMFFCYRTVSGLFNTVPVRYLFLLNTDTICWIFYNVFIPYMFSWIPVALCWIFLQCYFLTLSIFLNTGIFLLNLFVLLFSYRQYFPEYRYLSLGTFCKFV